ncbi:AAA family ATPase [Butyribacter sp.]|uniref:AAA family ATPase n=1 Tax=Butyribacter sp. TaxID=2822465 RepID=UPI002A9B09F7|nr:AAA family ATPase [Butyribacter sp.]
MKKISVGNQSFETIRQKDCFYVDKTNFISEWWESDDVVTLITRPRRFGKTLNMDMIKCFFSNRYENRGNLFEGLNIWKEEKYRKLQGTYPVIFLSFAGIKQTGYNQAIIMIKKEITDVYNRYDYIMKSDLYNDNERAQFKSVCIDMNDEIAQSAVNDLANYLSRYYGKKVIILLDEYDTPMQEAYVNGYWNELVAFTRSFFNSTFKTNPYLERGIMTGITRVSKESIFSDLNNLKVVTTTSMEYATSFGFTEKEVFEALDEQELSGEKGKVKAWYDGFTFGMEKDIYNPWSITNFLDEKKYRLYWADSSSNVLINKLIRTASAEIKEYMEKLISGQNIEAYVDEQIVFEQLDMDESAIWSLLLASGYLRVDFIKSEDEMGETLDFPIYSLRITNREVRSMFLKMFKSWFSRTLSAYNSFVKSLLAGDTESMNEYMNRVTRGVISYFDTGKSPSDEAPERFYHGLVLGLMVDQIDNYILNSNRESGFGRYDIMLEPIDKNTAKYPGIVIEFKVFNAKKENTLEETAQNALKQIKEKAYDEELIKRGLKQENIRHYGFAFKGKEVLIDTDGK